MIVSRAVVPSNTRDSEPRSIQVRNFCLCIKLTRTSRHLPSTPLATPSPKIGQVSSVGSTTQVHLMLYAPIYFLLRHSTRNSKPGNLQQTRWSVAVRMDCRPLISFLHLFGHATFSHRFNKNTAPSQMCAPSPR